MGCSLQAIQMAIDILTALVRRNPENRGYQRNCRSFIAFPATRMSFWEKTWRKA